jgi:hypothetical protein
MDSIPALPTNALQTRKIQSDSPHVPTAQDFQNLKIDRYYVSDRGHFPQICRIEAVFVMSKELD